MPWWEDWEQPQSLTTGGKRAPNYRCCITKQQCALGNRLPQFKMALSCSQAGNWMCRQDVTCWQSRREHRTNGHRWRRNINPVMAQCVRHGFPCRSGMGALSVSRYHTGRSEQHHNESNNAEIVSWSEINQHCFPLDRSSDGSQKTTPEN